MSAGLIIRNNGTRFAVALAIVCLMLSPARGAEGDAPVRFRGRVTDSAGRPIPNARVYVSEYGDVTPSSLAVRALTDADGRFDFEARDLTFLDTDGLPSLKSSLLSVDADGYGPDWQTAWLRRQSVELTPEGYRLPDFELKLAEDDAPIRGRFFDADGRPLAGARVRLMELTVPKERNLDWYLERQKKVVPIFTSPIAEERQLFGSSHLVPELPLETQTDREGRFHLSGLGRERIAILQVSAPSIADTSLTVMTRNSPDVRLRDQGHFGAPPPVIRGAKFQFQLSRGRTISGQVRDRDTGRPIPGMLVGVGRENFPRDGISRRETVTDSEGRFVITGFNPRDKTAVSLTAVSAPGMLYQSAAAIVKDDAPVVIECRRGIEYRLKLVDEADRPVQAEVTYYDVRPNPDAPQCFCFPCSKPISRASQEADGTYRGFVLPGPGAVLVKLPEREDYLPPYVDPKTFFAPGRTEWSEEERIWAFGSKDTIVISQGAVHQSEFAAIVLVNPPKDSGPLELSAKILPGTPLHGTVVGPDGKPITGIKTEGITPRAYDGERALRSANFTIRSLHPKRTRRVLFFEEERQLIGFLLVKGEDRTPVTVRMQPWSTITGRILGPDGKPLKVWLKMDDSNEPNPDPEVGEHAAVSTDSSGLFRIDKLVPGQRYSARIQGADGRFLGMAFVKLVLRPGEVKDLGDIRIRRNTLASSGGPTVSDSGD